MICTNLTDEIRQIIADKVATHVAAEIEFQTLRQYSDIWKYANKLANEYISIVFVETETPGTYKLHFTQRKPNDY